MNATTGIRPLVQALIDAGFISADREVERCIIDMEGGCSPRVYVQYAGDPDTLTAVLDRVARSMPIVETSTQHVDPRATALMAAQSDTTVLYGRTTADGYFEPLPGARFHRLATHREDALAYAARVERERRTLAEVEATAEVPTDE